MEQIKGDGKTPQRCILGHEGDQCFWSFARTEVLEILFYEFFAEMSISVSSF